MAAPVLRRRRLLSMASEAPDLVQQVMRQDSDDVALCLVLQDAELSSALVSVADVRHVPSSIAAVLAK
jgi:hypothetical protein